MDCRPQTSKVYIVRAMHVIIVSGTNLITNFIDVWTPHQNSPKHLAFLFCQSCIPYMVLYMYMHGCLSCFQHMAASVQPLHWTWLLVTRATPTAGTGHKILSVPLVFSSRFQGSAFRCDKIIVVMVTLLEAIKGIPDKDHNFSGNDKLPNLYERLLHERKLLRVDI